MNPLTIELVHQTVGTLPPRISIENGQDFYFEIHKRYDFYLSAEHLHPLAERFKRLFFLRHPDCEDDGDFRYHDQALACSAICNDILVRRIARNPALRLDDWGDLPRQLADPTPAEVQIHYADEYRFGLALLTEHPDTNIRAKLNSQFGKPIPTDNIAAAVEQAIAADPLAGMPLFKGL